MAYEDKHLANNATRVFLALVLALALDAPQVNLAMDQDTLLVLNVRTVVLENGQIFLALPVMNNVKNVHRDDSIKQVPRERSNFKDHVMGSVAKGHSVTVVV